MRGRGILLGALFLGLAACGGGDGGEAGDADGGAGAGGGATGGEASGGGGAGEGGAMPLPDVPFSGAISPLPADAEVDVQSFFPAPSGGVWRYRKRSAHPEAPEEVTQGGESALDVHADPEDAERLEAVRTTITIFDLPAAEGQESQKVRQVLKETYVINPAEGQVGPKVRFRKLDIEEREVGTERFVRTLVREYDPPYRIMDDAWRVGVIQTQISERSHMKETLQEHGQEMPTVVEGIADIRVEAGDREEVLLMEGRYREHVRQVEIFDDFSQQTTRTIWVQPGVGIVQWIYRDATNLTFTLVETNVEPAGE